MQADLEQREEDLKIAHAELKKKHDSIHQLKSELKISSEISAKLKLSEEQNKKLKNDVEMKEEEISSLSLSMEAQQKLIAEKETEVLKFKENLINYESLMMKFEAIQTKMDEKDEEFNR